MGKKIATIDTFLETSVSHYSRKHAEKRGTEDFKLKMAVRRLIKMHVEAALDSAKERVLNTSVETDYEAFDKMGETIRSEEYEKELITAVLDAYPGSKIK